MCAVFDLHYNYVHSDLDLCCPKTPLFWPFVHTGLIDLLFTAQSRLLTTLRKKPFENIVGKGENAGNQHFLLFPQCFLSFPQQISIVQSQLFFSSANAFNLDLSEILSFGKKFMVQPS